MLFIVYFSFAIKTSFSGKTKSSASIIIPKRRTIEISLDRARLRPRGLNFKLADKPKKYALLETEKHRIFHARKKMKTDPEKNALEGIQHSIKTASSKIDSGHCQLQMGRRPRPVSFLTSWFFQCAEYDWKFYAEKNEAKRQIIF